MNHKSDLNLFFRYTLPAMAGMLIAGSFSIVDTVFIGQGMGKTGLAAVALTWPLVMIFGAFGDMFGAGTAALVAQARGGNDEAAARKLFGNMIFLQVAGALALGAAAFVFLEPILLAFGATPELMPDAVAYARVMIFGAFFGMCMTGAISVVRCDGSPMFAMWLVVFGLLGNMLLDWLFIIVFGWGAAGAAGATVLSQCASCVAAAGYFLSPKSTLKFSLRALVPALPVVKKICVSGIPIFGNFFTVIAMLFMHNFQSLRIGGVDGLAAYSLVSGLESLGSLVMTGLAGGVQALTAYLHGARERERQKRMGNYGYVTAFLLGIALMIFSFALRDAMPAWIGLSGNVAELAAHGVLLSSSAFVLLGVVRVAGFYYQSTGKIADASLLIYGDAFFALPLCLFALPVWLGMDGVWLAMPVSRVILFAMLCYLWFGKKRKAFPA